MLRRSMILHIVLPLACICSCGFDEKRKQSGSTNYSKNEQSEQEYQEFYADLATATLEHRFFYEMFLNRGYNGVGNSGQSGGTARFISDIMFWFDSSQECDGTKAAKQWFDDGLQRLTDGVIKAQYSLSTTAPTTNLPIVRVTFDDSSAGLGAATYADDTQGHINSATISFGSNFKNLLSDTDILNFRTIVRHELGHVLAATVHSGMISNIMSYNKALSTVYNYQEYEIAAFKKLYSLPAATTLATLKENNYLIASELDMGPRILRAINLTHPQKGYNKGSVGDLISLAGERLNFPWGCSEANFDWPQLTLNDLNITVNEFNRNITGEGSSKNCVIFTFNVPDGSQSGPLVVKAYGKTSESLSFTVE